MASIKDAFEETYQDSLSIVKFILMAIPLFYCITLYNGDKNAGFYLIGGLTILLILRFMLKSTYNVRNGNDSVLPSFNIFAILWAGLKGMLALGPSIAINSWLAIYLSGLIENYIPDSNILMIFKYIIYAVFGSIVLTGYLCYAKTFKIVSAYDFKTISNSCIDILVAVIFMIPQVIIADALIVLPVGYILWLFFGLTHPVSIFIWCITAVFTAVMIAHYLAQVDYEIVLEKE